MKNEIKEIIKELNKIIDETSYNEEFTYFQKSHISKLLDYITNLQEKTNNQTEEINRLYKQREKFMKKYGYLKEENEKLKYNARGQVNDYFKDKYADEVLKNAKLQEDNEKLEKRNKEIYDGFIATQEELSDYATRNEKAIEYIRNNAWYCYKDNEENLDRIGIEKILSILGDENE